GGGAFAHLDDSAPPPAMPDWSPVRRFGGFAAWREAKRDGEASLQQIAAASCGCTSGCNVHGHDHARAWASNAPASDLRSFWGALGCACWAVCHGHARTWQSALDRRAVQTALAAAGDAHRARVRLSDRRCDQAREFSWRLARATAFRAASGMAVGGARDRRRA